MSAHRLLRIFAWLSAVVVIALPLFAASNGWLASERWPFRLLRIEGAFQHVSDESIRAAAVPALQPGYFAVDLDLVRARVQALAWIEHAEVRKQWPDQIAIRVTERQPLAQWGEESLLSASGEIFSLPADQMTAEDIAALPRFDGPEHQRQSMMQFHALALHALRSTDLIPTGLTLSARGAWRLRLADGAELVLGRDQAAERLARFAEVYRQLERGLGNRLARADLRYENGFALRWEAAPESTDIPSTETPALPPPSPPDAVQEFTTL